LHHESGHRLSYSKDTIQEEDIAGKGLDVSDIVPFRIGLVERNTRYKGDLPEYRMVLIHPTEARIFLTAGEMDRDRADREAGRANQLQDLLEKYRAKFGDLND
jgi:hypothetical protein